MECDCCSIYECAFSLINWGDYRASLPAVSAKSPYRFSPFSTGFTSVVEKGSANSSATIAVKALEKGENDGERGFTVFLVALFECSRFESLGYESY